jgi:hypothetical protein
VFAVDLSENAQHFNRKKKAYEQKNSQKQTAEDKIVRREQDQQIVCQVLEIYFHGNLARGGRYFAD